MFKRTLFLVALAVFAGPTDPAHAGGKNVAIIDNFDGYGSFWCQFLTDHGHACTVFPLEGPTAPLDPFDVVIDMSHIWSDPVGTLGDFMRAGKTVITLAGAPGALGIDSDPTVQAWIGANANGGAGFRLVTTARDPILGDIPPGTELTNCSTAVCAALRDTTGHPNAKVLAMYVDYPDPRPIGIMRNIWEGGVSVYMAGFFREFILNALELRNPIPTLNTWGLLALALGIGGAGTIVLWRRRSLTRPPSTLPALLIGSLLVTTAPLQAKVTSSREGDVTYLRIGDAGPFYSTQRTVVDLRSVGIPESAGIAVLWEETTSDGSRVPWYAISLGGKIVDEVRATSYDLRLRYAQFDPGVEEPAIGAALFADPDSELYIVQFVTQSLSEFRAGVNAQGATIYDFLPNHAHIAKLPPEARARVEALPFVRAVVPYHPAYRLEPFLRDNVDAAEQLFPLQRYNIRVFTAGRKLAVAARIAVLGGLVDSADAGKRMVEATLTPTQLYQVARFDEVLFIDRWSPMHPDMNIVRKTPLLPDGSDGGANYLQTVAGYRGSGVRGEIFDSGFNAGHQDFGNLVGDLACPVARVYPIEHGGPVGENWHGASTSGIMFGNGFGKPDATGLLPCGQGIVAEAYNVGLYGSNRYWHTCELVQGGCCPTDPPDPNCTPDPNSPYQAVFQSSSVGSGGDHGSLDYDPDMDDILFDFDLVHCQAQGNWGIVSNLENSRWSVPQAWAKNTISVGGVKHFNTTGTSDDRWCGGGDTCQTLLGTCASIGPAADGRVKPDLASFYDCIQTVDCCPDRPYCSFCYGSGSVSYTLGFNGTSAATPIVCGHVGLLMEMWADDADANGRNIFRVPVPSCNPAPENCVFKRRPHMTTPKAMLINTAKPYSWANPPYNSSLDRNKQGWGLPDIAAVYDFRNNVLIINENEADVLTVFDMRSYSFVVDQGDPAFKATLVYADPPGTTSASVHRINDLNLRVISPSGTTYWGNYGLTDNYGLTAGLWSVADDDPATSEADAFNTVENVFVQNPDPGTWTVRVRAYEINQDAHCLNLNCSVPDDPNDPDDADFALVVSSGTSPRGQCCLENPVTCERTVSCASSSACAGPGYTWFSEKTCAEVCELPRERLCCIPYIGICGLATPDCCSGSGGHKVETCDGCPAE